MKDYIEERIISIAQYTIEHNSTVRSTAKKFGISKSTVHKDLRERLPKLNMELSRQVNKILDLNKSERHIRGGLATKRKYMHQTGKYFFPNKKESIPEVIASEIDSFSFLSFFSEIVDTTGCRLSLVF